MWTSDLIDLCLAKWSTLRQSKWLNSLLEGNSISLPGHPRIVIESSEAQKESCSLNPAFFRHSSWGLDSLYLGKKPMSTCTAFWMLFMATSLTAVLRLFGDGGGGELWHPDWHPCGWQGSLAPQRGCILFLVVNEDFLSLYKRVSLVPCKPPWEGLEESGAYLT